jgi:hypothetical protein
MVCNLSIPKGRSIPRGTLWRLFQIAHLHHPANELLHHQAVGALHQAQAAHGAVPLAPVVEAEVKVFATEAAHLRVTAHDHI